MSATADHGAVSRARAAFLGASAGSAVLMASIHVAAPYFSADPVVRLTLVVCFFTCLATLAWSFTAPYGDYLRASWRWRFADAGKALQYNIDLMTYRQSRYVAILGWIGTCAATGLGLWVVSHWEQVPELAPFRELLGWLGWGAVLAVPIWAIVDGRRLREAIELRRAILEQAHVAGVAVRTDDDARREAASRDAPGVESIEPLSFRAGGYDWRWNDFYRNTAVFGQSGAGKTICVLNAVLDGLMSSGNEHALPPAGLVLDPKGDFRDKIEVLCRRCGRADQLRVIDPHDLSRSIHWNPLDSDDNPLELAGRFAGVMETLNPSSDKDRYFIDSAETFLLHMIALLRVARRGEPPSLLDVYECATSQAVLEEWVQKIRGDDPEAAKRAVRYVLNEWQDLAKDTKSVVVSFLSNMLKPFLSEPFDELFAGRSTLTVGDVLDEGMILYVHMPVAENEVMARVVSTFVKLEFYREVLRRRKKARPSFFLCDEFQSFFTVGAGRGDADAFDRTRESHHANVIAFQNLNSLYRQTERREVVDNLLGNCATKLFLRNSEPDTNKFASDLFGDEVETIMSSSATVAAGRKGQGTSSVSGTTQYAPRVRESVFAELAVPSEEDGIDYAETMAHLGARSLTGKQRLRWKVHPLTE